MLHHSWQRYGAVLALCAASTAAHCLADQPTAIHVPLLDQNLRQLVQDRDWTAAINEVDKTLQQENAEVDRLIYLKGRILHAQGQYDAAVAAFGEVQRRFPKGLWARRARFASGVALVKKGDFAQAERIYRAESETLLSAERRQEFADIYLEYADGYFDPKSEDVEPDYSRAVHFFEKALDAGPQPDQRLEVELLIARCRQLLGQESATELYEKFIAQHPDSQQIIEARFRLGECYLAAKEFKEARRTWQDLLAAHGESPSKWVAEASFELSRTWGVPKPATDQQMNLGVAALTRFLERFPAHERAGQAHLNIAESYIARERFSDAVRQLEIVLTDERYQECKEIPRARQRLGQALLMQERFEDALKTLREFLVEHPSDAAWSDVQRQVIDTEYMVAAGKVQTKDYDAGRQLLREFLAKYPLDQRSAEISFLLGQMDYEQKDWQGAIDQWRRTVSKFPKTDEASHAQYRIAVVMEEELGDFAGALNEYDKVKWGSHVRQAREARLRLTSKTMTVVTERVFRSNEKPRINLTTRNISSVTVRAYHVNMESYFRKMHLAGNVEQLDIALIDPDASFEFDIPDYQEHQQLENTVEIPLREGATHRAMAVTVSSKTLEATTLVVQSDLEVIVKAARNEVFIFAENMLTGAPWPGAKLLVSDGRQVLTEAVTGQDGVFQETIDQLRDAGDVRVLATDNGHFASNVLGLKGIGVAEGLVDKGYIYTDRPAYRAGQQVFVRGCIRDAGDGIYVVEDRKQFDLEVHDSRNRLIWQEEVTLGQFGTFHTSFALPDTSPQGDYRIHVFGEPKRHYQGTFRVAEYKLEPVRLRVDLDRHVYCRGEEIAGTICAEYYFGAPLAGREIKYRLANGREYTSRADENGEVRFQLPTREFFENQALSLAVSLPEWNVHRQTRIFLVTQGFSVQLNTMRDVFVAGEPFELTITTNDAEGKPVGRELGLTVVKLTKVEGKVGERPVSEHAIETTAKDGVARHALTLEKGGQYRLRATGADRWGNSVSGHIDVLVSDDDDQLRLRILSDRHTFKVGDQADVTLLWREQPALALVTFQADRVLDYRLVQLKTGANKLPIGMDTRLAPNFQLEAAVMVDARPVPGDDKRDEAPIAPVRFHTASSPFTVVRDLNVKVSYQRKDAAEGPIEPGTPMEVSVTTTDPQGKPVAAEVSLVMVEQALLERFAWTQASIDEFFRAGRRKSAGRTSSSIEFVYRPVTRFIDPLLLEEKERVELARQEAAQRQRTFGGESGGPDTSGNAHGAAGYGFGGGYPGTGTRDPATEDPFASASEAPFGKAAGEMAKQPDRLSLVISQTQDVASEGALPPLGETGYWNPAIVTDQNGKATVTVEMPSRSTAWTLVAKGITSVTLAGETTEGLIAKKDFFGQLKVPAAIVEGDQAEVIALVHNDRTADGSIDVTLTTRIAHRTVKQTKNIPITSKGTIEVPFKISVDSSDESAENKETAAHVGTDVDFRLTLVLGDAGDEVQRTVPLRPHGITVFATSGGAADASTTAWVEAPSDTPFQSPRMQILVGPSVQRSLLDIVLASASDGLSRLAGSSANTDTLSSDLMASLGLQRLLDRGSVSDEPRIQSLGTKTRASIASLVSAQNEDGGWGWLAGGKTSDRYTSARAVWALSLARRAGFPVPDDTYNKGKQFLVTQVAATGGGDNESKAILLHALCVSGQSDFSLANRLYRERPTLSTPALLYLALAFTEMDRKPVARDLLALVDRRIAGGKGFEQSGAAVASSQSAVEPRALHALVIQAVSPKTPRAEELVDWLLANRDGHRWAPDKATGPAALALCQWFSGSRFQGEHYKLSIHVNGHQTSNLDMAGDAATQIIDVPAGHLIEGKQRILFDLEGRGRYTYQVVLAGTVPAEQLKSTTKAWKVERFYTPAPLEFEGREIPRGFTNVRDEKKWFRNSLSQLPLGRRGLVDLNVQRVVAATVPDEYLEYLVITEPIPCGAAVIETSIRGAFSRFEIKPGAITFFIGDRRRIGPIHYELYGYLPGEYHATPTVVRNVYRPEQLAVATPKRLTVLPAGSASADPYRLTPQELYELGRLAFQRRDWQQAETRLTQLLADWSLNADPYRRSVEMLLDVSLELNKPAQVVRYFEIVHEKWPDTEIPFAKVLRIGAAYQEMDEHERSYLVYRAAVEGAFMRESGVAGVLASQGELLRSVDVMQRLLREYPPEPYVATAHYSLAQQLYAQAPLAKKDASLRRAGIIGVDLIGAAWRMLEDFLTEYPLDPAADQAAFATANALLELKNFGGAAEACERYAERYANSDLLDDFWFMVGYSRFALGQHEDAARVLRKVVASKPVSTTGPTSESDNKWPAIYILGQIYHSLGRAADAVGQYRLVEDRYPDAKKSIDYFLRKAVRLPEVTTVRPDQKVEVELEYRNVTHCDLKVYRIDLMKFALLRQSMAGVSRINLAGIEPLQANAVVLGDGKDYQGRRKKLSLDLKDEGAYLVVCRGGSLFASGLVLITPLELDVQYDALSREARATVKDVAAGKYVHQALVKVIGVGNADIVSGETDRRGLLVAQGIVGGPTVIAQADAGQYAFHREASAAVETELGDWKIPASAAPRIAVAQQSARQSGQTMGIIVAGPGASAADQRIEASLDVLTSFSFRETPIQDVAQVIMRQHRISVRIDRRALDDVGLGGDTPVTFEGRKLTLRSALTVMLKELDLTYRVSDESLFITTPEEAENELTTIIYPVSDLVRYRNSKGEPWSDYQTLVHTITSMIAPDTWDQVGGAGAADGMRYQDTDVLVVSQTQGIHRQVASLLGTLRSVARKEGLESELPLKEKSESVELAVPLGYGMGGMGGMGGPRVEEAATFDSGTILRPGSSAPGLLKGLEDTKRRLQGRQVDELKRIYEKGKRGMRGGMGAGGFF